MHEHQADRGLKGCWYEKKIEPNELIKCKESIILFPTYAQML